MNKSNKDHIQASHALSALSTPKSSHVHMATEPLTGLDALINASQSHAARNITPQQPVSKQYNQYQKPNNPYQAEFERNPLSDRNILPTNLNAVPGNIKYVLSCVQQPIQVKKCAINEKDKKCIEPPPMVRVKIEDDMGQSYEMPQMLHSPYLVMTASIIAVNDDGTFEELDPKSQTQGLLGNRAVSGHPLYDLHAQQGLFFIFTDLSVALKGKFRLKFTLYDISNFFQLAALSGNNFSSYGQEKATTVSDIFESFARADFPGTKESTMLTRHFSKQGVRLPLRNDKSNDQ